MRESHHSLQQHVHAYYVLGTKDYFQKKNTNNSVITHYISLTHYLIPARLTMATTTGCVTSYTQDIFTLTA